MLSNIIAVLDKERFEPVVVCPLGDAIKQFENAGAKVVVTQRCMHQFQHMSGYSKSFFHPRFLHGAFMQWWDRLFWKSYIRECGADIVHINAVTLAPMAWSAKAAGAKVVCLVQETAIHGILGLRNMWLRHILAQWTDAVVYISEYDKRTWCDQAPCVEVISNWVDFKKFDKTVSRSDARQVMGFPTDAKIILFMGGVNKIKGTLPLLQSMLLLSDMEDLLLVIAGYNTGCDLSDLSLLQRIHIGVRRLLGMDYHRQVFDFVNRHALKNRVRFIGMTDEVVSLYAASDVVVFPAVAPHQARPVLEAGAMCKPVVVTDFKNITEFVRNDQTGLTVPLNDSAALANAIRRILVEPALAARLGAGNFEMAHEKHNLVVNGQKFVALYERLAVK